MQSDPDFSDVIRRAVEAREVLGSEAGAMLGNADVQNFLGIAADALRARVRDASLLAVPDGAEWLFPAFQFSDSDVWPLLPKVLSAMNDMEPWSVVDQLLAADPGINGATLLELVKAGDAEGVDRIVAQHLGDGFT